MRVKDAVGRYGEQCAADHLAAAGLEILARNWRCRAGELDIVARDGSQLVFVEVKTRSSLAFGTPAEAVDRRSRRVSGSSRCGGSWLSASSANRSSGQRCASMWSRLYAAAPD